ncbi:MAG TPA: fused MFS/spermidine synthase [Bryobacteraceae bacterium]|nr:fused MFS/spermidine synthase [Bryobacteraceae bacterium]
MPAFANPQSESPAAIPARASLPLLFGLTIFASACLLFLVQPLAARLLLPWFGGSAAVWITCLLFFQAGLLLGYLYAHGLTKRLPRKVQALLHAGLLTLSLAALPILPNAVWQPHPGADPTWPLFGALATSVGLPYLLLASTTPLLQSWYARSRQGALPYRYFALSNAGSLIALLSYPAFIEPRLTAHQQAQTWSIGFVSFAALCVATAFLARQSPRPANHQPPPTPIPSSPLSKTQIALWLSLSACASTLLLAVTNLLTLNVAPMPLLWVLPLSLYLLSFILCFESDRWYKRAVFLPLVLPALACLAAAIKPLENQPIRVAVPLFTGALFICCLACHGELARLRPPAAQLTAFYLFLAAGGALGGLFVALLAPHLFPAMYEYPIAFAACPIALLAALWREHKRWTKPDLSLALWLAALAATMVLAGYACRETWYNVRDSRLLVRNFYGALRVDDLTDYHRKIRELTHGTIIHGVQFLNPLFRHQPTTYYGFTSGIGLTWNALSAAGPLRMGIVGLGAGTLAAYGRSGDTIRFYDINPAVIRIAQTQFTYLADCPAHVDIVLGDARLSLAREPSQRFDILVIDAFSGDSIPVHLLTREAFQIYWRHLKPDGVLAVHISNHYLDLAPVVELAAEQFHKQAWQVDNDSDDPTEVYASTYVLVSNRPSFFDQPFFSGLLTRIDPPPGLRAWTDDYSNLWQILKFK